MTYDDVAAFQRGMLAGKYSADVVLAFAQRVVSEWDVNLQYRGGVPKKTIEIRATIRIDDFAAARVEER